MAIIMKNIKNCLSFHNPTNITSNLRRDASKAQIELGWKAGKGIKEMVRGPGCMEI